MALRRRGERRIDAAYDTLCPVGFSRSDVKLTVENLKKVYGRNEAWVFIEEGSYKLLIDTILENQEKADVIVPKEKIAQGSEVEGYATIQINGSAEKEPGHLSVAPVDSGFSMANKPAEKSAVQVEERMTLIDSAVTIQREEKETNQEEKTEDIMVKENNAQRHEMEGYDALHVGSSGEVQPEHLSIAASGSGKEGVSMVSNSQCAIQGEEGVNLTESDVQVEEKDQPTVQLNDMNCSTNNVSLLLSHENENQEPLSGNRDVITKSPHQYSSTSVRRRPCYGWVVDEEDEDDEILDLGEPGTLEAACRMANNGMECQITKPAANQCIETLEHISSRPLNDCKKRKPQWDVEAIM